MILRPALRPPLRDPMRAATALKEGGGDIITSIFADGTDGFYFDFSKTDRLFQTIWGETPADGAGENIALALESSEWGGRTFAAEIGVLTELLGTGVISTIGSPTLATYNTSTGEGTVERTDGSNSSGVKIPATAGKYYYIDIEKTGGSAVIALRSATVTGAGLTTNIASGRYQFTVKVPTGTGLFISSGTNAASASFTLHSIKEVPAYHGEQATTAAQPKWQTGGLARFDGSDDNLLTTLSPGAGTITMMGKAKITNATGVLMGGQPSGVNRCFVGTDAGGLLSGGIGTQSNTTIKGGGDIRNTTGVMALTADGSLVKLYWNGVEIYSAAQAGTPSAATPIAIGGLNIAGTVSPFMAGDLYYALAAKKALTAAQIAAITNLWGTS